LSDPFRVDDLGAAYFVSDAVNVVGFDPFRRLVDYLVKRAG